MHVSIRDTLAVPGGEGRYNAAIALHEDLTEAYERDRPLSRTAFGGEKAVVVMTSGLDIGIESGIAAVSDSGLNTVGPARRWVCPSPKPRALPDGAPAACP